MYKPSNWIPALAVFLSALCLTGYLCIEMLSLNVRLLVLLFGLALIFSFAAVCLARPKRLGPLLASICAWALLWPTADSVLAWSAWWLYGFGP